MKAVRWKFRWIHSLQRWCRIWPEAVNCYITICASCGRNFIGGYLAKTCSTCKCDYHERMRRGVDGAHYQVKKAIAAGELADPSLFACVDCGKKAQVYDHRDYHKPLEVEPVCQICNARRGSAVRVAHPRKRLRMYKLSG